MVERRPGFIKRHTPKGRYEEYQAKHAHLVSQTQGEARYLFEKKIDMDAKKYARNSVARDILVAALLTTGAVLIGREIKNKTLISTLTGIPDKLSELSTRIQIAGIQRTNAALQYVGGQIAEGASIKMEVHLPVVLEVVRNQAPSIGEAAAHGALQEVGRALPGLTTELEYQLEGAGKVVAAQIMATIESGMPHMAETFAASLRSIPGLLLFGRGKK